MTLAGRRPATFRGFFVRSSPSPAPQSTERFNSKVPKSSHRSTSHRWVGKRPMGWGAERDGVGAVTRPAHRAPEGPGSVGDLDPRRQNPPNRPFCTAQRDSVACMPQVFGSTGVSRVVPGPLGG